MIRENPCENVNAPKPQKGNIDVLTVDHVHTLLKYTKSSDHPFMYMPILLSVSCGMIRCEILGLKWDNVDLDNGIITIIENRVKAGKDITTTTPKLIILLEK